MRNRSRRAAMLVASFWMLAGCVQLVSPYNPDVKKTASDMEIEIATWDTQMRRNAGTVAADPRDPDVQAALDGWNAQLQSMLSSELGIDPGIVPCDTIIRNLVPNGALASPGNGPQTGCEVHLIENAQDDLRTIAEVLNESQCRLPWLSDAYFQQKAENKANQNAPPLTGKRALARGRDGSREPTPDEQAAARANCAKLFRRGIVDVSRAGANDGSASTRTDSAGGILVRQLIKDLRAIVYIENRKKT